VKNALVEAIASRRISVVAKSPMHSLSLNREPCGVPDGFVGKQEVKRPPSGNRHPAAIIRR